MTTTVQLRLRCPQCDALARETQIDRGRFTCVCGASRHARDPESIGSAERRWRATNELRRACAIDMATAYSVLLELISIEHARRASRAERSAGDRDRDRVRDRGCDLVGDRAGDRVGVGDGVADGVVARAARGSRDGGHAEARAGSVANPGASAASVAVPDAPVASAAARHRRSMLVAATSGLLVAVAVPSLMRVTTATTVGPSERVHISAGSLMQVDAGGTPLEIRAAGPADVLRRYCRATGCRPVELAIPAVHGGSLRVGLFRSEDGALGAIRIERRSSVEWAAGRIGEGISVEHDPVLPPNTPKIRLAR